VDGRIEISHHPAILMDGSIGGFFHNRKLLKQLVALWQFVVDPKLANGRHANGSQTYPSVIFGHARNSAYATGKVSHVELIAVH
jgi:hypothetical protein